MHAALSFSSHGVLLCMQGALTVLKDLAAYPHLANGDYADVNREIRKIITKDSNIQVRVSWCVCVCVCTAQQDWCCRPTHAQLGKHTHQAKLRSGRSTCMPDVT